MRQQDDIEAIAARRVEQINAGSALVAERARLATERFWAEWHQREDMLQGPPLPEPPGMFRTWDRGLQALRLKVFWQLRRRK